MERSARSVRRARRVAYRQRTQNRLSMFLISMVVLMILVVVVVGSIDVRNKIEAKAAREQQVDEQIADEESRAKEIEEFEKEVQTNPYRYVLAWFLQTFENYDDYKIFFEELAKKNAQKNDIFAVVKSEVSFEGEDTAEDDEDYDSVSGM